MLKPESLMKVSSDRRKAIKVWPISMNEFIK